MSAAVATKQTSRFAFASTYCSQCGQSFGPGYSGYSACYEHRVQLTESDVDLRIAEKTKPLPRPFVVIIKSRYRVADAWLNWESTVIVSSVESPDPTAFVREGHELMRAEVFPASKFRQFLNSSRRLYLRQYQAYLAWADEQAGLEPCAESAFTRAQAWCAEW